MHATGQRGLKCGKAVLVTVCNAHIYAAQPTGQAKPFLCRGDIRDEQAVEAPVAVVGQDCQERGLLSLPLNE